MNMKKIECEGVGDNDGFFECDNSSESELSALLCWGADKPNKVGYYWLKNGLSNALIVDVFSHNGQFRFMVDGAFPGVGVGVTGKDSLWAGPIELPAYKSVME